MDHFYRFFKLINLRLLLRLFIFAVIFPYIIHYFVYFGFVSNYSFDVFSEQNFKNGYDNGIFRYRVLGKTIFLKVYEIISANTDLENIQYKYLKFLDENGNMAFYKSYFLVNVFFNICTIITLFLILSFNKLFRLAEKQVNYIILIAVFFICISQYVITPYDAISYFAIAISFPFITAIISKPKILNLSILLLIIIVATLTRESSAIILAIYGSFIVYFWNDLKNKKKHLLILTSCIIAYLSVYLGLRMYFGFENGLYQKDTEVMNLNFLDRKNQVGLLFFVASLIIIFLLAESRRNSKLFSVFLIFCIPYIAFCWFTGVFFEIRLWIPVILPGVLFINLSLEKLCINKITEGN